MSPTDQLTDSVSRAHAIRTTTTLNTLYETEVNGLYDLNYGRDKESQLLDIFGRLGPIPIRYLDRDGKKALATCILSVLKNEYVHYNPKKVKFFTKFPKESNSILSKIKSVFKSIQ
ncbi:hypothetical protein Xoosp13_382 [Xanthomonas phage Xoo-sp13]|nr:hypothetical protein Xoosp13_382 [Xanthomonas phage Xoo-sp13]